MTEFFTYYIIIIYLLWPHKEHFDGSDARSSAEEGASSSPSSLSTDDAKMLAIETGLREAVLKRKAAAQTAKRRAEVAGEEPPGDAEAPLTDAENAVAKLEIKFKSEREAEKTAKKAFKAARSLKTVMQGNADSAAAALVEAKAAAKSCDAEVYEASGRLRASVEEKAAGTFHFLYDCILY